MEECHVRRSERRIFPGYGSHRKAGQRSTANEIGNYAMLSLFGSKRDDAPVQRVLVGDLAGVFTPTPQSAKPYMINLTELKKIIKYFTDESTIHYCIHANMDNYIRNKLKELRESQTVYSSYADIEKFLELPVFDEVLTVMNVNLSSMGLKEIDSDQLNKYIYSYGGYLKAQSVAPYQIVQDLIKHIDPPDDGSSRQIEQGGRQWKLIRPEKIKNTFLSLGSRIVRFINGKFPERPLRISGSLLSMELSPRRFQADDIDIDYYNPEQKEPRSDKLWNKVKYSFQDIHKVDNMIKIKEKMTEDGNIVNSTFGMLEKGSEITKTVDVEMKNISSRLWREGWKDDAIRETGKGQETAIPKEQLYMDTCLRIVDIMSAVYKDRKEKPMPELISVIQNSVDAKQYMMKKLILEEYLIMNNKLPDALKLAADKLEDTTYRRWYMVFKANTIDKKLVRKFFASM